MSGAPVAVRVVAAVGLMLVVAALVYAVSNGRLFLFPFLLLLGFPMAAVFRRRNDPPGPPGPPPRISLN
ncbi:MAG TPA: hypothetical protein VJP76_08430 [Candidatus Tumulicola sp.]|nr:hypothetical protein [Candidatus Tumulicola sp.]